MVLVFESLLTLPYHHVDVDDDLGDIDDDTVGNFVDVLHCQMPEIKIASTATNIYSDQRSSDLFLKTMFFYICVN